MGYNKTCELKAFLDDVSSFFKIRAETLDSYQAAPTTSDITYWQFWLFYRFSKIEVRARMSISRPSN